MPKAERETTRRLRVPCRCGARYAHLGAHYGGRAAEELMLVPHALERDRGKKGKWQGGHGISISTVGTAPRAFVTLHASR
jgi:hypothetical protein